jgi:uroporphyrinogen III methyltransferase/synthase
VFGRGGEEALELRAAGIPFEVVPGVTSAIAAPAYAGIPVTYREYNTTLTLVTGHEDERKEEGRTDWAALSKLAQAGGTLVLMMGVKHLGRHLASLRAHGLAGDTPAALVRWGTFPQQRELFGTAETLAEQAHAAQLKPPAVCVVGRVVGLHEALSWFTPGPLAGRKVLLTRAAEQSAATSDALAALGAQVFLLPAIEIAPPLDPRPLRQAVASLARYDWVALTSANGARAFLDELRSQGKDARALAGLRLACVGEATAQVLRAASLTPDLIPPQATGLSLGQTMGASLSPGARALAPLAEAAGPDLPDALRAAGVEVEVVCAYRSVPPIPDPHGPILDLKTGKLDAALFASPSAVKNLAQMVAPDRLCDLLSPLVVACIGPTTARAAQALGVRVDLVPAQTTAAGMVEALASHLAAHPKEEPHAAPSLPAPR